ncbi:MAG TPA: hypothetical protein VFQ83_08200 [Candidatus Udaeobacter sp.]|jgi:hypothetical protein|nr:hypothetical protein [Candidatus Udaeobacter sp.]
MAAWRGSVNLAALRFNQYNVRSVVITLFIPSIPLSRAIGSLAAIGALQFGEFSQAATARDLAKVTRIAAAIRLMLQ